MKNTRLYILGCKVGCLFCKTLIFNVYCGADGTLIDETRNNTISTLAYIIPGFIDGNVMYCSLPQDDGGTTLLRITL